MKTTFVKILGTALIGLALLAPSQPSVQSAPAPYLDPALVANAESQGVIVTAESAAQAAEAVGAVGGTVTSELWLIDAVAAVIPAGTTQQLIARTGVHSVVANRQVRSSEWDGWVTDLPLPAKWDGRPDVQPTNDPSVWNVVNPVPIDIGADVLHRTALRSGELINGEGVTVAVVDSGVYFDATVRAALGKVVTRQFLGQADFINSTCQTATNTKGKSRVVGNQRENFCWLDHADTSDGYGHGTAVASIIWNNFTDANTGVSLGVAPGASVLSVRVLDDEGQGSYETVIKGIQFVVKQQARYDVRVMNLSISALPSVPYFVDPLNRAVEKAWLKGITVVVAAGNDGPTPGSVTVPGNDPYVLTVGALDEKRTPGYWADDELPTWSAAGPTGDGFVKPDLVAPGVNIISFMYKDPTDMTKSQRIVQVHPDNAATTSLFRMNGTSMSAAVASGVVALVIQANPKLKPDQIKYRMMAAARPAAVGTPSTLVYPVFRQGMGRIWAPDAALGTFASNGNGNPGMNLRADLMHGYLEAEDLAFHYQGPIRSVASQDGAAQLYYLNFANGQVLGLGSWSGQTGWLDAGVMSSRRLVWVIGGAPLDSAQIKWAGGVSLESIAIDPSRRLVWVIDRQIWEDISAWTGANLAWQGAASVEPSRRLVWVVGRTAWEGGVIWSQAAVEPSRRLVWVVNTDLTTATVQSTSWVETP